MQNGHLRGKEVGCTRQRTKKETPNQQNMRNTNPTKTESDPCIPKGLAVPVLYFVTINKFVMTIVEFV